jgi:hypothetical protein
LKATLRTIALKSRLVAAGKRHVFFLGEQNSHFLRARWQSLGQGPAQRLDAHHACLADRELIHVLALTATFNRPVLDS